MTMARPDWRALSDTLWIRSSGRCERCGWCFLTPDDGERHHRRLRSAGGRHELPNLVLLCRSCHTWAHGHPHDAMDAGWIVSRYGRDPGRVPVKHAWHGMVLLTADGGTRRHVAPPPSRDLEPAVSVDELGHS